MDNSIQRWQKSVCSARATYKEDLVIGEGEGRGKGGGREEGREGGGRVGGRERERETDRQAGIGKSNFFCTLLKLLPNIYRLFYTLGTDTMQLFQF